MLDSGCIWEVVFQRGAGCCGISPQGFRLLEAQRRLSVPVSWMWAQCVLQRVKHSLALDPHPSLYCVTWVNYFTPSVFSVLTGSYPPHWSPVRFLNIYEVLSTTPDS